MNKKGFSLIEVMVGITLLSGMSLMIFSTMSGSLNAKARVEARDEQLQMVRVGMGKMVTDLSQTFLASTLFQGKENAYMTGMKGDENHVNFSTMNHYHFVEDAKDSEQMTVGYFLERDDSGTSNLMRRASERLGDKIDEGGRASVMIEGVREFKLQYYHARKQDWVEDWDTGSVSSLRSLPQAVKISLTLVDKNASRPPKEYSYTTIASVGLYNNELNF